MRMRNGRAQPYSRFRYVELGNEEYNALYVQQAAAMEARARILGKGGLLRYLYPAPGPSTDGFLSTADLLAAQ